MQAFPFDHLAKYKMCDLSIQMIITKLRIDQVQLKGLFSVSLDNQLKSVNQLFKFFCRVRVQIKELFIFSDTKLKSVNQLIKNFRVTESLNFLGSLQASILQSKYILSLFQHSMITKLRVIQLKELTLFLWITNLNQSINCSISFQSY